MLVDTTKFYLDSLGVKVCAVCGTNKGYHQVGCPVLILESLKLQMEIEYTEDSGGHALKTVTITDSNPEDLYKKVGGALFKYRHHGASINCTRAVVDLYQVDYDRTMGMELKAKDALREHEDKEKEQEMRVRLRHYMTRLDLLLKRQEELKPEYFEKYLQELNSEYKDVVDPRDQTLEGNRIPFQNGFLVILPESSPKELKINLKYEDACRLIAHRKDTITGWKWTPRTIISEEEITLQVNSCSLESKDRS